MMRKGGRTMLRRAFTLLEVNLAMMVMGGAVLSIVVLYSLGFRESVQSNEDVASAALADAVLGRAAMALSDRSVRWEDFKKIEPWPNGGWAGYFESNGQLKSNPSAIAEGVFGDLMDKVSASGVSGAFPAVPDCFSASAGGAVGLTVSREQGSPVVHLAFRAAAKKKMLLSAPIYYTAVCFQGTNETDFAQLNGSNP